MSLAKISVVPDQGIKFIPVDQGSSGLPNAGTGLPNFSISHFSR
jgi:hypothetical protein